MKKLLDGALFSWLREGARKGMTEVEIEMMVNEFTGDLMRWCDGERNYSVVARGLEGMRIRLQVWSEVLQAVDGTGKKRGGDLVRGGRVKAGGARDPVGPGAFGTPGMVRGGFG